MSILYCAVADPGFPRGRGANPKGGAPTYYFVNFFRKLHENKEILGQRGGRASLAPPLRSATAVPYPFFILHLLSVSDLWWECWALSNRCQRNPFPSYLKWLWEKTGQIIGCYFNIWSIRKYSDQPLIVHEKTLGALRSTKTPVLHFSQIVAIFPSGGYFCL